MVGRPSASVGHTGSIPVLGEFHRPQGGQARVTTTEPKLLGLHAVVAKAFSPETCAPQQEKPQQWDFHTSQLKSSPHLLQLEKAFTKQKKKKKKKTQDSQK